MIRLCCLLRTNLITEAPLSLPPIWLLLEETSDFLTQGNLGPCCTRKDAERQEDRMMSKGQV